MGTDRRPPQAAAYAQYVRPLRTRRGKMSPRKAPTPPPIEPHEFRSVEEIERGIRKVERRIEEVKALDARKLVAEHTGDDDVVESNVRETIREIFGTNSPEFQEHQYIQILAGPMWMGMEDHDLLQAREQGKTKVANILQGLIDRLRERLADFGPPPAPNPVSVFGQLNLHPRIAEVATRLFRDGHHWDAVFAASKALVNYIKELSNRYDLDGADLMRKVFSKNSPILKFNDLKDQTDADEQEGLMHLFEGAVLAIRNPGGHAFPQGPADLALEYINLLSLLAHLAQKANR